MVFRRAYTLREMMAYSLYNSESTTKGNLIYDQSSTIRNMAQWMRQKKNSVFGVPFGQQRRPHRRGAVFH
ncbi:hypothetical protein [Lawsonibacter sp. JLR.KK007]|uniref:hypothetical protein n=1 Tax=Lawsonibacter sp. JLR.KK007 TaxID=3114293 RepID=UPI002FEFA0C0